MLRNTTYARPESIESLLGADFMGRLTQLDLTSRKIFAGKLKGERRSKRRGQSIEFADHRPYSIGDDLRHIDWNIFGRLDRMFLKLFLEEEDLSLHILLDDSASMDCGEPPKFLLAQQIAAALGYIGLVNLNRVTLTAMGMPNTDTARTSESDGRHSGSSAPLSALRNLRGRRRAREMGEWVCGLRPERPAQFTETARRIAMTRQGRGVMIILSDLLFDEGYEQGLRYLVGRGYDLVLMQILSPQEVDPPLGGDLRLVDVETGRRSEVTISRALLNQYKRDLGAYCEQLRSFCARRDITHITVQSDTPIASIVMDYLRSRGVLR